MTTCATCGHDDVSHVITATGGNCLRCDTYPSHPFVYPVGDRVTVEWINKVHEYQRLGYTYTEAKAKASAQPYIEGADYDDASNA